MCCGTGAGIGVLRDLGAPRRIGADLSAGMLAQAEAAHPDAGFVRADALALPFEAEFDLAVSFGAFGHFLPAERPPLFASVYRTLRPGGLFAFPIGAPLPVTSALYWITLGFDTAMRVRNAVWRPPFVMYYRTFPLGGVRTDLRAAGFDVSLTPSRSSAPARTAPRAGASSWPANPDAPRASGRRRVPQPRARSSVLRTLPPALRGSSATNSTSRGTL